MASKIKLIAVVIIIYITFVYGKCNKSILGCAEENRSFQIYAKAYPDKDSIRIGDTLWFEVNAPTTLKDGFTGTMIDYSGAENLGSAMGFVDYSVPGVFKDAANTFDYYLLFGTKVNNPYTAQIREYLFEERDNRYLFKLGVIPKEKGVFGIGFSGAGNVYRKSNKCTKASFAINFENTNEHHYLNPNYPASSPEVRGYYFKVL